MTYKVLKGEDMDRSYLDKVFALDKKVYGPIGEKAGEDFVGTIENMVARFNHNNRTFVCLMKEDTLVGYINFFPVTDKVWEDIVTGPRKDSEGNPLIIEEGHELIWDDDLGPNEILPDYLPDTIENGEVVKHNNLFIISVVIDAEFRGKEAITQLTAAFVDYLNDLEKKGFGINAISAYAVSSDGEKFLRERMFGIKRYIVPHPFRITSDRADAEKEDSVEVVYLTEGVYLRYLLEHPNMLYRKTIKDDLYLFLPYEDSPDNHKLDELLSDKDASEGENVPDEIKPLLSSLDDCLRYEYKSKIVNELKRVYIGSFRFLHSMDEYPEDDENPYVRGEEIAHVSLLAHHATNMYVVMLCIPNCRYSSSQVEDQLFQGYIKIRPESDDTWQDTTNYGVPRYINLNDYLREHFGLYQCGNGKALLCMSDIPKDTMELANMTGITDPETGKNITTETGRAISQEFLNILACETYQSVHQDFFIRNNSLIELATKNHSIYDYYETYMSENMVAFVLKDFPDNLSERMELTATYIFIVELVLFQNTTLNKLNNNVSAALSHEGDVSYDYIDGLYRDYAKTIKFWNSNNFKYYGTQQEAEQIKNAFENEDLRDQYNEQQEFLEHMVDVKSARAEERNGMIINIFASILAVIQIQDFAVRILGMLYERMGMPMEEATSTFDVTIIGGGGLFVIILAILSRKKRLSGLKYRQPWNDIKVTQKKPGFTFRKFEVAAFLFFVALGLSYLRPLHMVEGGEVTCLSTVVLFLIAYFFGGKAGIAAALIYSVCKFAIDYQFNILDHNHIIAEIFDYSLGYGVVGIGGFWSEAEKKPGGYLDGFWKGYLIAVGLRYIEGVINCSYFYDETIWYSIKYCMGYIGIEIIITILILLIPKVREAIEYAKEAANS